MTRRLHPELRTDRREKNHLASFKYRFISNHPNPNNTQYIAAMIRVYHKIFTKYNLQSNHIFLKKQATFPSFPLKQKFSVCRIDF